MHRAPSTALDHETANTGHTMKHPALDAGLNAAILQMAPAFSVSDYAPQTMYELAQCERLIIWAGGSDQTIYSDPAVNWAFRAWHDSVHLMHLDHFTFDLAGETHACEMQILQLRQRWPSMPERWARIIRAEIIGQAQYLAATGDFPVDQYAFIKGAL